MASLAPGDNLYKFMAILGLALLVFAFAYPLGVWQGDALRVSDAERDVEIARVHAERKKAVSDALMERYKGSMDALAEQAKALRGAEEALAAKTQALDRESQMQRNSSPAYQAVLSKFTEEKQTLAAAVADKRAKVDDLAAKVAPVRESAAAATDEMRVLDAMVEWQGRLLAQRTRHYYVALVLLGVCGTLGAVLSLRGFGLWYFRIQRHLDEAVVKKQA